MQTSPISAKEIGDVCAQAKVRVFSDFYKRYVPEFFHCKLSATTGRNGVMKIFHLVCNYL